MQLNVTEFERLDPFDHAFVDAVLHLRGIDSSPTRDEFQQAIATLSDFYTALMKAPASVHPEDEEWLGDHTLDSAAGELAFLFTQFGLLYSSQATAQQRQAFAEWWSTGDLPRGR